MRLIDSLKVRHGMHEKSIEIYVGDLADLTPDEAVDVLVVSAFPDDYLPTPHSLIGALDRKGVSVAHLATDKFADLRQAFSCWMSREIAAPPSGIAFKRILCFEPLRRGAPPQVVGDIFRSLAPFLDGVVPITSVAVPLVACGDAGVPVAEMLGPLLDAAAHWLALGFPLSRLKIVAHSDEHTEALQRAFARLKDRYWGLTLPGSPELKYDVFISYAHADGAAASLIVEELRHQRPNCRIYRDTMQLQVGAAWQREIYEAIDTSHRILALYSPAYVNSKVCQEEFNLALHRRRELSHDLLFPIYLHTAHLPNYMRALVQYEDCREAHEGKLRAACTKVLAGL